MRRIIGSRAAVPSPLEQRILISFTEEGGIPPLGELGGGHAARQRRVRTAGKITDDLEHENRTHPEINQQAERRNAEGVDADPSGSRDLEELNMI